MKIGVFGGAFDPPHLGHFQVVTAMLQQKLVDQVWWVPVKKHAFGKNMANDTHRLAMLGLDPLPQGSRLELCEIQRNAMSYTHQTLLLLAHQHPEHTFIFLIGSDNLAQFHTWDCAVHPVCPPFMLKEFPFYVYPRGGYPMSPLMEGMVPLTNLPEMTISSTEIRERARQGRSLAGLVTPKVAQYIEQHHLYHS